MTIQIDSREKARAIQKILAHFGESGVRYYISKLYVGDYMNIDNPRLVIDRKQNLIEVAANVCQQHARFVREIQKANEIGVHLVFLVEHGGAIHNLEDVRNWNNPRLKDHPLAMSGERLYKVMLTMQNKYDIEWQFCDKRCTGRRIVEILNNEADQK